MAGKAKPLRGRSEFIRPDGTVVPVRDFDGNLVIDPGEWEQIKQQIGYSTGAVNYYPKRKIKDIVAVTRMFFDTWNEETYREYLSLFALDENKMPAELSEGMRVKFNLLLALSHKSEILILDEPTSGLDPFSRDELLDIFEELKKRGVSILFSTHITSDIEKCADDILYIRDGKLVANYPKEDFRKNCCEAGETIEQAILRMERGASV